jgi:FkbM family methyltransferase
MKNQFITYAQNREDVLLDAFFNNKNDGFFVDVGAYDPIEDSVTQHFYLKGWRGINIEPNPERYKRFVTSRSRDLNVNAAISDTKGKIKLRVYKNMEGLATVDSDQKKNYEHNGDFNVEYEDIEVDTKPLKELFEDNNVTNIDFLKIDVEGHEYQVLTSNDWKKFRPVVICIEAKHIAKDWRGILEENKYQKVFFDGLNEYYFDTKTKESFSEFDYVKSVIGKDIITYDKQQYIGSLQNEAITHRSTIENLIQKNSKLLEYNTALELTLKDSKRLKSQIKGVVRAIDNAISVRLDNISKREYKHIPVVISNSDKSLNNLLNLAHEVDEKTYRIRYKPGYAKVFVSSAMVGYKSSKFIAKKSVKGLKSIKRALRGNK